MNPRESLNLGMLLRTPNIAVYKIQKTKVINLLHKYKDTDLEGADSHRRRKEQMQVVKPRARGDRKGLNLIRPERRYVAPISLLF